MALRQIISRAILPGFEEELANVVGKEVRAMQRDLCPLQSGTAFSYRRAGGSGGGGRIRRDCRSPGFCRSLRTTVREGGKACGVPGSLSCLRSH